MTTLWERLGSPHSDARFEGTSTLPSLGTRKLGQLCPFLGLSNGLGWVHPRASHENGWFGGSHCWEARLLTVGMAVTYPSERI
jgi:hypothetical protein